MAFVSESRVGSTSLRNAAALLFAQVSEAHAKRKLYNQTFNELSSLTNAELADIGINRSMIKSVAREAADLV